MKNRKVVLEMKKIAALCLTFACLLSLFACAQGAVEPSLSTELVEPSLALDLTVFTEYLEQKSFVPGLGQKALMEQMGRYRYKGEPISEFLIGYHYDGIGGGGYRAFGEYFGFGNDYHVAEDDTATYSNCFYTELSLEGLELPCGITFDDTFADVLQKLGMKTDPRSNFVLDKRGAHTMTLQKEENSSLALIKCDRSERPLYEFELRYTESYQSKRYTDTTRSVTLSFSDGVNQLARFDMEVVETYKTK